MSDTHNSPISTAALIVAFGPRGAPMPGCHPVKRQGVQLPASRLGRGGLGVTAGVRATGMVGVSGRPLLLHPFANTTSGNHQHRWLMTASPLAATTNSCQANIGEVRRREPQRPCSEQGGRTFTPMVKLIKKPTQ